MELRITTEPQQGATYDDLLALALLAEELEFGGFFTSDHYLHFSGDGLPGPLDAWTTLAGLARDTTTIRLGTLMTSATFRHPGPLAVQVAQVDRMSGGRVELGIGAGWFAQEHEVFRIPFPSTAERFDNLETTLEIVTGLWSSRLPTRQKQGHRGGPPILIGGLGARRTPALAAAYADELNVPFADAETTRAQFDRVRAAAEEVGRDPETIIRSAALEMTTPDATADAAERLQAAGAQRIYLQVLDPTDLDAVRRVAARVGARLG